jgi:hypothetical protein
MQVGRGVAAKMVTFDFPDYLSMPPLYEYYRELIERHPREELNHGGHSSAGPALLAAQAWRIGPRGMRHPRDLRTRPSHEERNSPRARAPAARPDAPKASREGAPRTDGHEPDHPGLRHKS